MTRSSPFADTLPPERETGPTARSGKGMLETAAPARLFLPHQRDQSTDMTDGKPDAVIGQAKRDLSSDKQDTSKAPEMNRSYQKQK